MQDLTISMIQSSLAWEDKQENLSQFGSKINSIDTETDLIILPEMFSTGFSMKANGLAEPENGPTLSWMIENASRSNAVICGSFIVSEGSKYYNRLFWVRPDGTYDTYNKRHLFRLAGEQKIYAGGTKKLIVNLGDWRICPMICYDLRFPVWSRYNEDYDLLLFIANWPERRNLAWRSLLRARAIENLSFVAGLNRVGVDGNEVMYSGDSAIYHPSGDCLEEKSEDEAIITQKLSLEDLIVFRRKFQFYKDRDQFIIPDVE